MGEGISTEQSRQRNSAFRLWVLLFIVLALLGVAGAGSYVLLQQVTRIPTAADIAQRVCTAYTTQNYQLLISQIDPAPVSGGSALPTTISSSGQFDSNTKNELVNTLQSLDTSAGPVTSCQQSQQGTGANSNRVQFVFVMRRAYTPTVTYTALMNFVQHSGTWMVARDSNFTGTPG